MHIYIIIVKIKKKVGEVHWVINDRSDSRGNFLQQNYELTLQLMNILNSSPKEIVNENKCSQDVTSRQHKGSPISALLPGLAFILPTIWFNIVSYCGSRSSKTLSSFVVLRASSSNRYSQDSRLNHILIKRWKLSITQKLRWTETPLTAGVDGDLAAVSSSYGSRSTVNLDGNLSNSLTFPTARRSCGPIERPTLQRILKQLLLCSSYVSRRTKIGIFLKPELQTWSWVCWWFACALAYESRGSDVSNDQLRNLGSISCTNRLCSRHFGLISDKTVAEREK